MKRYRPEFYDPLNTRHLTLTICRELERQPLVAMLPPDSDKFTGAGLYAIYYRGNSLSIYRPLADLNVPVYVGQALSDNSRTGDGPQNSRALWKRMQDHRKSIAGADLPVPEFPMRLLRLPDVHANMGENGLRRFYQPVWNTVLSGFGSHEQGRTTRQSGRSKWDTIHPGRNRTYGDDKHDSSDLMTKLEKHIKDQVKRYNDAPWREGSQ